MNDSTSAERSVKTTETIDKVPESTDAEEVEYNGSADKNLSAEDIFAEISNGNMTNAANQVDLELIMDGTVTEDNIIDHITGLLTSENVW